MTINSDETTNTQESNDVNISNMEIQNMNEVEEKTTNNNRNKKYGEEDNTKHDNNGSTSSNDSEEDQPREGNEKTEYRKEIKNNINTSQENNINYTIKQNKYSNNLSDHNNKSTKITSKQTVSFGTNEWTVVTADGKARLQFLLSKFTSSEKIDQTQTNLLFLAIKQAFYEFNLVDYVLPDYEPQGVRDTAHAILRAEITGNLKQFCNEEYNKMRIKIRNPYSPRKTNNNAQDNTSTPTNKNSDFITFKRIKHIRNQHVGVQYAKQSLEVAETFEANEHRIEFSMTLEIKCDRIIVTKIGLCQ